MKAYVLIKIRISEIPAVVKDLRSMKNVIDVDMTFGPYDAVAIVKCDDLNELGNFVAFSIQCVPGVLETLTCLAVQV